MNIKSSKQYDNKNIFEMEEKAEKTSEKNYEN